MALFKISKGNSANLPADMHDGYCYFTIDDGKFYIDYIDINDNDTLKRRAITGVSVEYIEGTQTASTNAWTGVTKDANLYKGKIIAYKLPYKGTNSAATLTLTLSNGTSSGAKAIKRQGASSTTTHYPAGTVIFMAYDGAYWQVNADYDSNTNTFVTQSVSTSADWRKVLLHYSTNAEGGAVPAEVTNKVYAAEGIEVQPSTGTLKATKFKGPLEGNADTATEFSSNANVTLTGDVSGSANSTKGWNVTTTLATTGVTAGSYGPSANATPDYGATFNVPYITVDAKGRITAASTKTVKIPAKVTLSGGSAAGNDATVVGGVTVSNQTVTVAKKTLTAGAGFTISGATDKITLKPKLKSETAVDLDSSPMGNTANRQYPVGIDKSGYLSVNIPWTNTWRGIQDNLTSDSATDSLSAKQGKILNEKIDGLLMAQDAMVFKGIVIQDSDLPTSGYSAGWTYRAAADGIYKGEYCEVGDLIIAVKDYDSSTASNADWTKIEHNIDGALFMGHAGSALSDGTKLLNVTGGGIVTTSSSTVGSLTKPVFLNAGTLTEITHSLNATVNSGTANQVAYYSDANTIDGMAPAWQPWTAGSTNGPQANIQIGNAIYQSSAIPSATATNSGIVTTAAQTFAGDKTFNDDISANTLTITSTEGIRHIAFSRSTKPNYIWAPDEASVAIGANSTLSIANTAAIFDKVSVHPGTTNTFTLGTSDNRWKALYIGTANSYGGQEQPIYWNNGVPEAGNPVWTLKGGSGIPSGTDLNTITTIGNYWNTTTTSRTILNNPYSEEASSSMQAYQLKVETSFGSSEDYLRQQLMIYNSGVKAERHSNNGGSSWSSWRVNVFKNSNASTKEGDSNKPVYIAANGQATAIDYAINATISSGTAQYGIAYYSTTTNIASTAQGTNGALLTGKGANAPAWKASANGAVYATSANGDLQWGTLPIAQGGTGNTSYAANRLIYSESTSKLSVTGHYADATSIAINSTTIPTPPTGYPTYNLYINGDARSSGDLYFEGTNNKLAAFKLTTVGTVSRANIDMGWDWERLDGAGAAFRSTDPNLAANQIGRFVLFARTTADDTTQLVGAPTGELSWKKASGTARIGINADANANYNLYVNGTGRFTDVVRIGNTAQKNGLRIYGAFDYTEAGEAFDTNDRPSLMLSGAYPQIWLLSNANNTSHGSTITIGGTTTANATSGDIQAFTIETSGAYAPTNLTIGYGTSKNPHYNTGITSGQGTFIMRLTSTGRVGILTGSPSYPLHVTGDMYTSGWARAASGFYCHDTGVHYTHNGNHGEINITKSNEMIISGNANTLYINYRAASRGTLVTTFRFHGGSSSSYSQLVTGHIVPGANNTYNLGNSSVKWANIYMTTAHGALDGNATTSSYPQGFTGCSTGETWGNTVGTSITQWSTTNGGAVAWRYDNPQSGQASLKVDGTVYINEGQYPVLAQKTANGFPGLLITAETANHSQTVYNKGWNDSGWLRTTVNGFIPYQSGGASAGHSSLGTSSWYFANAYIQNAYLTNIQGRLTRAGVSSSWWDQRDNSMLYMSSVSGLSPGLSLKTTAGSWSISTYNNSTWNERLMFSYVTDTNYTKKNNTATTAVYITSAGVLMGAAWNDYAEYRETKEKIESGRCVKEIGDDTLEITTKRLERGCEIVSDTYGFAIGETETCQTPIASSGRVLAYPYESREEFASHIGWPVCSGPNGTVSIMTEEEEEKYPSRIIGTISAVPDYEEWGTGNIKVNGRVWIRIR